jgi:uncharacterized membrane protein
MDFPRFWRHIVMTPFAVARSFPPSALDAIQREVALLEAQHRGEIRFVVEAELTTAQLLRGLQPRERARQVFALQGVWNTEENTGVLVYVLLADRAVEIVADRGISARVGEAEWAAVCRTMEAGFRAGRFEEGAVEGVRAVAAVLGRHFPGRGTSRNELPDRPLVM